MAGLGRYPAVWIDEGWVAEPGYAMARGLPLGSPSHGEQFRFADRYYWNSPLVPLLLSVPYRAGAPPLTSGRALSVAAGALTLAVLLLWFRRLRPGSGAGAILVLGLLFTLDAMLWKTHRTVRYEAWTGLWAVCALASAWCIRSPARGGAATGGFAALALLSHPNGALAAAAAGVVLAARPSGRVRALAWAAGVGAACLVPWAWYLAGDREAGFANFLGQNSPHVSGEGSGGPWSRLAAEPGRYASYFALPALAAPLVLWAATLVRGWLPGGDRRLAAVLAVVLAGLAALPNKSELYLTLAAPVLYLAVAVGWDGPRWYRALAAAAVLNFAAADAALLWRNRACDYDAWVSRIRDAVPPGALAAGTFVTWFPFRDGPYVEYLRNRAGDLAERRPPYLIWDRRILNDVIYDRLRAEMEPILARHAEPVAESESSCYGRATVYRMRWDELSPAQAAALERWAEPDSLDRDP